MSLREKIVREIRECGPIPFSRYMELCLSDPELGYYSRNAEQFGKAGDFYTSSDVHAVFGRLMARQFEEMWRALGSPAAIQILELGPGRGLFAQDVLDWGEKKFPDFFRAVRYFLLESSPKLRERLREKLSSRFQQGKASLVEPATLARVLAETPTIVFANEFFDALPVEILTINGAVRVTERASNFEELYEPASEQELEYLDHYGIQPEPGERIEVLLAAQQWMEEICCHLKTGFVLVVDYGYSRQEQLAGRHRGTLMTYRQHSASPDPYQAPGEQDITAHVNFTALTAIAQENGLDVQPLLTQSQFLLGIGEPNQFADAFEDCRLPQEKAKVALQLKHLITPSGIGETFHVLFASKGVGPRLVQGLSGLNFARNRA
jgi:SAM-dependent MidA family methyltransferase